jgi:hypothetical protein
MSKDEYIRGTTLVLGFPSTYVIDNGFDPD